MAGSGDSLSGLSYTRAVTDWDAFFDSLYFETYIPRLDSKDAGPEALAAVELSGATPGADVLDCPCGFGRHSIPIADAGYCVVGVDRSPEQIAEARRRAGDREWPQFAEGDYRALPFEDASFDAVLNLFSSLGYHGEDADCQALREFRRVLRSGGALVVETMHRDRLMAIFRESDWEELPDGGYVLERRAFDSVTGLVQTKHVLIRPDGRRSEFEYEMRPYTATELDRMLTDAGFAHTEYLGDLLEREPLSSARRLVAVART